MTKVSVLMRYLSLQFLKRFALILIGLTGILQLFDVLASADDILKHHQNIFNPLSTYMYYRIPQILTLCFPFAALLSAMLILSKLVSNQEIIALRAVGVSSYQLIVFFSGALMLIIAIQFLFANTILPPASNTLRAWADNDYRSKPGENIIKDVPGWFELGGNIIKVGRANDEGAILYDVDVLLRDKEGLLTSLKTIPELKFENGAWISKSENIKLNLPFNPEAFSVVKDYEQEISYGELMKALYQNQYISSAQKSLHILWVQKKFASPLSILIMLLVSLPIALQVSRRGHIMMVAGASLLAGFSYFILERIFLTLGENAYLPSIIAIWVPFALFTILSLWILTLLDG